MRTHGLELEKLWVQESRSTGLELTMFIWRHTRCWEEFIEMEGKMKKLNLFLSKIRWMRIIIRKEVMSMIVTERKKGYLSLMIHKE